MATCLAYGTADTNCCSRHFVHRPPRIVQLFYVQSIMQDTEGTCTLLEQNWLQLVLVLFPFPVIFPLSQASEPLRTLLTVDSTTLKGRNPFTSFASGTADTYLLNNYFVHQALNNVLLCFLLSPFTFRRSL